MYSAASELSIMQDRNNNGSLVTKFSRTNKTDKNLVNISGVSKQGRSYVRQTVANKYGRVAQKNYVLPEDRIMHLLTKSNTHNLMRNLDDRPHLFIEKKTPAHFLNANEFDNANEFTKKASPKKATKKASPKKVTKKASPKKATKKASPKKATKKASPKKATKKVTKKVSPKKVTKKATKKASPKKTTKKAVKKLRGGVNPKEEMMKSYDIIMTRGNKYAKNNATKLLAAIKRDNKREIENIDEKWKEIGKTKFRTN